MQTEKDWIKSAYIQMNKKFIHIGTYSGHVIQLTDFDSPEFFFDRDVEDDEIGRKIFLAIENSRFLSLEEATHIRMDETRYLNWIKNTMKTHGLKNKNDMFKPMFYCNVRKKQDGYLLYPTHQRAITDWEGNEQTKKQQFTIPLMATAVEMGAALRRCLALCTSKFDPPKDV